MNLILQRYSDNRESTQGLLFKVITVGAVKKLHFMGHILEDEFRDEKVMKETRIPAGLYPVEFNKAETPLTLKYRAKFPSFFTFHLEIKNIPNFKGVYMHIGNSDDDTEGCPLMGDTANNNNIAPGAIGGSTQAFIRNYKDISDALNKGEKVFIEVRDEAKLF